MVFENPKPRTEILKWVDGSDLFFDIGDDVVFSNPLKPIASGVSVYLVFDDGKDPVSIIGTRNSSSNSWRFFWSRHRMRDINNCCSYRIEVHSQGVVFVPLMGLLEKVSLG